MKKSRFFPLLLLLPLISCSFFKAKIPPYPGGVIFPLAEEAKLTYEGEIVSSIQRADGALFFVTRKGIIYCFDGQKREVVWKFSASAPFDTPPRLTQESVLALDRENTIYCLDKEGKLRWQSKIEGVVSSPISENQGKVFFSTEGGEFFALNAEIGEQIWAFRAGAALRTEPVFWAGQVVIGCSDGKWYFLDENGNPTGTFDAGDKILPAVLLEKNRLYYGTENFSLRCLELGKKREKWKVKTGGKILSPPVADEKRIYFVGSNNILSCLKKTSGEILWWKSIPSRSPYHLEKSEDKIVVASLSPQLVCFEDETGKEAGKYVTSSELRSNPLWMDPYLLINLYDSLKEEGSLVFLKKDVNVMINSSLSSPRKAGDEISFSALPVGFFRPRYEFFLKAGEKKDVVQKESEKNTWVWFPDREGVYMIGVKVSDAKQTLEAEIPFDIIKEEIKNQRS